MPCGNAEAGAACLAAIALSAVWRWAGYRRPNAARPARRLPRPAGVIAWSSSRPPTSGSTSRLRAAWAAPTHGRRAASMTGSWPGCRGRSRSRRARRCAGAGKAGPPQRPRREGCCCDGSPAGRRRCRRAGGCGRSRRALSSSRFVGGAARPDASPVDDGADVRAVHGEDPRVVAVKQLRWRRGGIVDAHVADRLRDHLPHGQHLGGRPGASGTHKSPPRVRTGAPVTMPARSTASLARRPAVARSPQAVGLYRRGRVDSYSMPGPSTGGVNPRPQCGPACSSYAGAARNWYWLLEDILVSSICWHG